MVNPTQNLNFQSLLLVEDDLSLGQILEERLSQEYAISWVRSGFEAIKKVEERKHQFKKDFDLILLDVGLPDINGFQVAQRIKPLTHSPFLFLTAQSDAESRLKGYQLGAEEYIPKPFHLKELLIRIDRVIKAHPVVEEKEVEGVRINFSTFQIRLPSGEVLSLASSEIKLLEYLIKRSPEVLDRDEIMTAVWGAESELSHRSIDNMIVKLRSALGPIGEKIKTIRGRGYQWI